MAPDTSTGGTLLIVNADDLGRTEGINAGVFEAHGRGLVTSATLMVNYPASTTAAAALAALPNLGVGLHVALTGGVTTLAPERVPSLVDDEGRLPPKPEGLEGAEPEEILAEVRAQLQRFQALTGRLPTHLDSHHHSHRRGDVCDALVIVAREAGLPVRNPGPPLDQRLREAKVSSTDSFIERFFGAEARLEVLLEILRSLGPGTTELMCHPAYVDDELRRSSSYLDEREEELAVLAHPEALEVVRRQGIVLGHFGAL